MFYIQIAQQTVIEKEHLFCPSLVKVRKEKIQKERVGIFLFPRVINQYGFKATTFYQFR